jgi:CDP-diglyceride synthetase
MSHHTIAALSLAGVFLDVLGGLYLAYDLLGGQNGPLRLLTRIVTYSIVFGAGYGIGLGFLFGVFSGIAAGITIAIELQRAGHRHDHIPLPWEILFSALRGAAFGAGLYPITGLNYAALFSALIAAGQAFAYTQGMRPGLDYAASRQHRLTQRQISGVVIRTIGAIVAALFCSAVFRHVDDHAWWFALRLGLVIGLVTAVGTAVNPYIEYFADHLPERRLGAFGICLVLCGFALQTVQYWVALLDYPVA